MKNLQLLSILVALSVGAMAQPNYSVKPYRVTEGQKINKYTKAAKGFIKSGNYTEAAMNAAYALRIATKKGQISNSQQYLHDSYNRSVQANLNRIEILEENTESFEGDQTVTEIAEIIRLYKAMRTTDNILKEVPAKSLQGSKKKDPGFHPTFGDYKSKLAEAKENLTKAKEAAAKMHYAEARKLESQGSKLNARMAAKRYRWSDYYVPDYRDANERYDQVKKLGTTRMGLMKFESNNDKYGDIGALVSDKLLNMLAAKALELEFFEVIDRNQLDVVIREQKLALSGLMDESTTSSIGELKGVDVILVGNISSIIVDKDVNSPTSSNHSASVKVGEEKYINKKGKEKTRPIYKEVYATVKIAEKYADAAVGGSFKVLDVKTGNIVKTGISNGTDHWRKRWITSYSGDKRALPNLSETEPKYPSSNILLEKSSTRVAEIIYKQLLSFALDVGK